MPRSIALQVKITDEGQVLITSNAPELSGLYHLVDKTDAFLKALLDCLAINDKALGYDPNHKPKPKPPGHTFTR